MSYAPIAFTAPNYRDYKDWWIKPYEPGTTTPKYMAADSTLVTLIAKAELNKDGFIKSAGGALIIPYIDGAYDLWLFPTEAEADANDTVNALRIADNITSVGGGSISDDVEEIVLADLSQDVTFEDEDEYSNFPDELPVGKRVFLKNRQAYFNVIGGIGSANTFNIIASLAVSQSIQLENTLHPGVDGLTHQIKVHEWGAVADGVTDAYGAIQAAIEFSQGGVALVAGIPQDLDAQNRPAAEIVFDAGTYYLSSTPHTRITTGYDEDRVLGLSFKGQGAKTILTRNNLPVSGGINFNRASITDARERFDNSCLAINGSMCSVKDISFKDSYIGLYLGDNPNRTDIDLMTESSQAEKAHSSHGKYERLWFYTCGAPIFSESTHGCYYNTFQSILMRECQVGIVTQEMTTAVAAGKTNRNTFINIRANRCVIGYMFNDFNTNTMISVHAEDCGINSTGIPSGLLTIPSTLSAEAAATDFGVNGGGHLFELTAAKNFISDTVNESCDNDLFNAGLENSFDNVDMDLSGGLVFFEEVPRLFVNANTEIYNTNSYKNWGQGAAGTPQMPDNRVLPGHSFDNDSKGVPFNLTAIGINDTNELGGQLRNFRFVDKIDSLADTVSHTIPLFKTDNTNGEQTASVKVVVSTRDTTGAFSYYAEYSIVGGLVGTGTGIDRSAIVKEDAFRTIGASTFAATTDIVASLTTTTTDTTNDTLNLVLQCDQANGFDMLITTIDVTGGLKVDG